MNGAAPEPRISGRLLFSITMVNTVPDHRGCAVAAVGSTRHAASVLPELLGVQPAATREPRTPIINCDFIVRKPGQCRCAWQAQSARTPSQICLTSFSDVEP